MSSNDNARISRRRMLRGIAAGTLTLGGIGTVAAQHGEKGGNKGGGGPPEGHGPGSGNGGNGNVDKGPTGVTGGSGIMFYSADSITTDPPQIDPETGEDLSPEDTARFELGTYTGNTREYWTGCEAAGDPQVRQQTFKEYTLTWLDGPNEGNTQLIYIYQKKPVNPGTYNMTEASECGYEGNENVAKVGYEPSGVEHGDE